MVGLGKPKRAGAHWLWPCDDVHDRIDFGDSTETTKLVPANVCQPFYKHDSKFEWFLRAMSFEMDGKVTICLGVTEDSQVMYM